jgi:nuclear transport factor 2 (NTF2) superfamily protein
MTPEDVIRDGPLRVSVDVAPLRAGRLPDEPVAFVAAAERATNERALDVVGPLYAPDATFVSVTDGAVTRAAGRDEIVRAWRLFFAFLAARDFRLAKRLLVAADGVIVNEWTGSLGGRTHATGIEAWRFDDHGLICEHTLYSYLDARPATSPRQRLRLLAAHPRTALAFARAERRVG